MELEFEIWEQFYKPEIMAIYVNINARSVYSIDKDERNVQIKIEYNSVLFWYVLYA